LPLVVATLISGLEPTRAAPDSTTAANIWTLALVRYLSAATPPLNPAILDPAIRGPLSASMAVPNPSPDTFCRALDAGLVAALTQAIPLALPGVTPVVPLGLLPQILMPLFAAGFGAIDQSQVLNQVAIAIDMWAKGITPAMPAGVHYLVPGAPPVPTPLA
jgi:hypothetical protein